MSEERNKRSRSARGRGVPLEPAEASEHSARSARLDAESQRARGYATLWLAAMDDGSDDAALSTALEDRDRSDQPALSADHKARALAAFARLREAGTAVGSEHTALHAAQEPLAARAAAPSATAVAGRRVESRGDLGLDEGMKRHALTQRDVPAEIVVGRTTPLPWFSRRPLLAYALGSSGILLAALTGGPVAGSLLLQPVRDQKLQAPMAAPGEAPSREHAQPPPPPAPAPVLAGGAVYAGQLTAQGGMQLHSLLVSHLADKVGSQLLTMVRVPAGSFDMGSDASEPERQADEGPVHRVTFARDFYVSRFEITRALWREVASLPQVEIPLDPDPAYFNGSLDQPGERVSYWDAIEFCQRLSRATGRHYRLPTEAEWEYAARAGAQRPFAFGERLDARWVNYDCRRPYGSAVDGASHCVLRERPIEVGSLQVANDFGLLDTHGNVWEWVQDAHSADYRGAPADGSARAGEHGANRVARGGGWKSVAADARSAARLSVKPGQRVDDIGFRVVAEDGAPAVRSPYRPTSSSWALSSIRSRTLAV